MSFFVAGPYDDGDAVTGHYYEVAHGTSPQVWAYTDALSYAPGDTVVLHGMSTAATARVTVVRDGLTPQTMLQADVPMGFHPTPPDCSVRGCDWPEVWRFAVPDWRSGVYVITLVVDGHSSQHMFVLRAATPQNRLVMVLTTGTWCAYNDWGGSNHYQGLLGPRQTDAAHDVSLLRPWARGFVRWPDGAPRIPHASPLLTRPRYPHMDYARARGISKKYASSGWAAFERPFALWCEAQGIGLDYITQHDLHRDGMPAYPRAVIAGHDEYWTWDMRDHLEAWLDKGGQLARFAGNFYWQTRLSGDLLTQTCWKTGPDPVRGARRSTYWDAPEVGRPAVATMGLTGSMGVYAGWSRCAAHGSGGFAVYRPEHWCLQDSGLGYGDVLGASARIFAYEVDGVEYGMKHGLPFADDPALQGDLAIIAMSPATTLSHHTSPADRDLFIGYLDAEDTARMIYGAVTPETMGRASRGNGCMAEYRRGRGVVFNAGSCEWVNGLTLAEPTVQRVTRRVLVGAWG
jgi:hypothetical protein